LVTRTESFGWSADANAICIERRWGIVAVPGVTKVARTIVIVFAITIALPLAPATASTRSSLEQTRRDLRAARARLNSAVQTDAQILGVLSVINHKLAVQQSLLAVAQNNLGQINIQITSVQRQLTTLEKQRRQRAAVIAKRARALYIMGPMDSMDALTSATNIGDFYARAGTLEFVAGYDKRVLQDLATIRNQTREARAVLKSQLAQAASVRDQVAQRVAIVNDAAAVQQQAHAQIAGRIAAYRSEVASLQRDQAMIEGIIAQRSSRGSTSGPAGRMGFAWPTVSHRINSPYGPRWGGFHTGIDIWCPQGNPDFASKAGTVIAAEYAGGYGNMTIIDHGGGYSTLYAHQSRIYVHRGQTVQRGKQIGACGATGNATGAHLHFEIRINGNHTNPSPYLP
jgi:murein DD-endopeptidase MepM/ murein hydrolase activator NlpD